MTKEEAYAEAQWIAEDGKSPVIIHVTYPSDRYVVFRNEMEKINWQNMNAGWDIRFEEVS